MTDNDRLCVFDRFVMRMLILKLTKNNSVGLQMPGEMIDGHR